jgi:hypothetical protein
VSDFFIGIMTLQEAKNHDYRLKNQGISLVLKSNPQTCTTGCKVTVEVWAKESDLEAVQSYFKQDLLSHLKGHEFNEHFLSEVFDSSASEVVCQACGAKFSPSQNECPDCGLVY